MEKTIFIIVCYRINGVNSLEGVYETADETTKICAELKKFWNLNFVVEPRIILI